MRQRPFRIGSNDNTLFVTAQCNNRCMMCCQPPQKNNDIEHLFSENIKLIDNAPKELATIGITGGEPTLLGNKLIQLVSHIRNKLPDTEIQLLTNGRLLKDKAFAQELVAAGGDQMVLGIPLHSDYGRDHDKIAGAAESYNETILGLYNAAEAGGCIELRVVINQLNHTRLEPMAEFIYKNLPFVAWTAFMGMERTGWAEKRQKDIWIEPRYYVHELREAVLFLDEWGHETAIYNIPLCLLTEDLYPFAKKSISDWKCQLLPICTGCKRMDDCCGTFSTSTQAYEGIKTL